jgi:acyl-lipid omega-6 desaturase (Delta-12 desaturase)
MLPAPRRSARSTAQDKDDHPPMTTHGADAQAEARAWGRKLAPYRQACRRRSILELVVTAVPFIAAWAMMAVAMSFDHYWLYALLMLPTAGLLVRLFMIQHDCGHSSFFGNRMADDWAGRILGVVTLTPYDHWRRSHAIHHASTGNLDERGIGDIDTLTVEEYRSRSAFGRLKYRLYRNPLVMFGVGPFYMFLLQNRLPVGSMRSGWQPWISTMATNAGFAIAALGLIWLMGWGNFLLVHIPVVTLAATAGVWLFYIQHQFEDTHWAEDGDWDFHQAALHGSSHYDLPPVLRWFSANIGMHHVHHLSSRIPFYRLPEVLRDFPELRDVGRLTLLESLRCVPLALWDERQKRLISFRELRQQPVAAA